MEKREMSSDASLLAQFNANITRQHLISADTGVLLAVSGGLDSIVLLDLFTRIQAKLRLRIGVVHVHHGLRGREADRDLDFVNSLSERYRLPFYLRKVNAAELATEQQLSLEESARILRYRAFDEVLRDTKSTKLATAHTANDQVETIIDHFLRGSGVLGLTGIPRSRGPYIRPLLDFTRNELETYAMENGYEFREDSSNQDLRFRRNRIRRELIPYLESRFNPNLTGTLKRTVKIWGETEVFLNDFAHKALKSLVFLDKKNEIILDIEGFLNYFDVIRKYIIFQACDRLSINRNVLNFNKLERIIEVIEGRKIGKKVIIHNNCELIIDHDGIVLKKANNHLKRETVDLLKQSALEFNGYELRWSVVDKPRKLDFARDRKTEFVDFDLTGPELQVRTFRPGDRFKPLNLRGHKKVANYFSDQKIPHRQREITPILESPNGIVWICGHCIDDRFKVTDQTTRILRLEMAESAHGT